MKICSKRSFLLGREYVVKSSRRRRSLGETDTLEREDSDENKRPCEEQKKNVVLSRRVPGKQQQQEEVSSDQ